MPRLLVVKRNASREDFDQEKLLKSMMIACRKRTVDFGSLREATDRIERELLSRFEEEVASRTIGSMVMEELRDIDQVAFVRFASVYQDFATVDDFKKMIESVQRGSRRREKTLSM